MTETYANQAFIDIYNDAEAEQKVLDQASRNAAGVQRALLIAQNFVERTIS